MPGDGMEFDPDSMPQMAQAIREHIHQLETATNVVASIRDRVDTRGWESGAGSAMRHLDSSVHQLRHTTGTVQHLSSTLDRRILLAQELMARVPAPKPIPVPTPARVRRYHPKATPVTKTLKHRPHVTRISLGWLAAEKIYKFLKSQLEKLIPPTGDIGDTGAVDNNSQDQHANNSQGTTGVPQPVNKGATHELKPANPAHFHPDTGCVKYAVARRPDLQGTGGEGAADFINYHQERGHVLRVNGTETDLREHIRVGDALVWGRNHPELKNSPGWIYGHVAIIEEVQGDRVRVSQAGWKTTYEMWVPIDRLKSLYIIQ